MEVLSFIRNKIVLRSIVALIAPLILYSIGYGIYKAIDPTSIFEFSNVYAWIVLACLAVIYPIN
jgi:hypothetical protein